MRKFLPLMIFSMLFSIALNAQKSEYSKAIKKIEKRGEVFVEIKKKGIQDNEVFSRISIDEVKEKSVMAYLSSNSLKLLQQNNYKIQVLESAGELFNEKAKSNFNYTSYPSYQQYDSLMNAFVQNHPDLCKLHSLATLNSGREILALQISDSVNYNLDKPQFLYTSSMHGDELVGYVLMLRLIDYLLSNYGSDTLVNRLVKNIDIWINPLANPNGAYYTGNSSVGGAIRYNLNGVDLNRNFPDPEDGQHPDGNSWQEETMVFMGFADTMDFVLSANLHGGAEVVNYPWDTWQKLSADDSWWQFVSRKYADTVHNYAPQTYMSAFNNGVTNGYAWYEVAGGRQDFMNYFHHCREFTLELSDYKLPSQSTLDPHWNYNYRSLLNYIDALNYGLRGMVTDSATSLPISAKVEILNHDKDNSHVYSDSVFGSYCRLADNGFYDIKFSKTGYKDKVIQNVKISTDSLSILNVELAEKTDAISNAEMIKAEVFPNPFSNSITIDNIQSKYNNLILEVHSVSSGKIAEYYIGSSDKFVINAEKFASGIYILQIKSADKKIYFKKIIKI